MRDESIHLNFGCHVINTIKAEHPEIWTKAIVDKIVVLVKKAVELECIYVNDACEKSFVGINANHFCDYVKHIADRRLERLNIDPIYNIPNPLPWMSQSTDLPKEKNFFETRVTEYQASSSLEW